jgi:hypothetical protein
MLRDPDVRDECAAPTASDSERARRVLEGPEQDARLMGFRGMEDRAIHDSDGRLFLRFALLSYAEMRWSHRAALARLEGAGPQRLAGGALLLDFRERPQWHPEPGLIDVLAAVVHENPDGLTQQEAFLAIHKTLPKD